MVALSLKRTIARLDLLSLRLFLAVCEEQSIGKAAEREGIVASAVTKRIQELEHLFGVELLYRNRKATTPTPVGSTLVKYAHEIFNAVEATRVVMSEYAEGLRGHIRVRAVPSAVVGFFANDLHAFMGLHPQVAVELQEDLNLEVVHSVETRTSDIGIVAFPTTVSESVETFPYQPDELVVLLPVGHQLAGHKQISFTELLETPLIGLPENTSQMKLLNREALEVGKSLKVRFQVKSNEVAISMVAAGLGTAVVPNCLLASNPFPNKLVKVALAEPWATRNLRICVRKGESMPTQVRELLDFLRGTSKPNG